MLWNFGEVAALTSPKCRSAVALREQEARTEHEVRTELARLFVVLDLRGGRRHLVRTDALVVNRQVLFDVLVVAEVQRFKKLLGPANANAARAVLE